MKNFSTRPDLTSGQKNVLVIVYDFPPLGGGGIVRVLKLVKYLPSFGWRPIVLTVQDAYYPSALLDTSLLEEIPEKVPVYRTPCLRPRKSTPSPNAKNASLNVSEPAASRSARAKQWLRQTFFVKHDSRVLWYPYAIPALRRIAALHSIDLIFTSSPPHNVHLLGALARRYLGKPWVVDFRDAWVDDPTFRARLGIRRAVDRRFERRVIRRADFVVSATPTIDNWFRARYGPAYVAKSIVLLNGYDPADFPPARRTDGCEQKRDGLVILHAGSLGGSRTVRPLLEAYQSLVEGGELTPGAMRIELLGLLAPDEQQAAQRIRGVTLRGHLSHAEAIERMCRADVLLVVNSVQTPYALTGKIFEYIAAQRPVLALTPPGPLAQLIDDESLGIAVPCNDVAAIRAALSRLYRSYKEGTLWAYGPSPSLQDRHNRRTIAQNLAAIFDRVAQAV